ncbi:MAG: acyloxyacyl hydrolase [Bacteroidetes bacterium]|nr:acyloxyacyl hydrolase [Bacteroidota bacterium]
MKRSIALIFLLFTITTSYAQTESIAQTKRQYPSVSFNYEQGRIIPTTKFVKGENLLNHPLEHYSSYSLKILWQNPGYKEWQRVYKIPYYGGGISMSDFDDSKEIGRPVSVYGILGIPVFRLKRLQLYTEMQFGMACNWVKYDSVTNPKNLVIGGRFTVHLNLGMTAFYSFSDHFSLGAGMSFIHFSNGGMERPNRGFNIYSPSVELKYQLAGRPAVHSFNPVKRNKAVNDLYLMMGYGNHQLVEHEMDSNYFAIAGISAIFHRQFSNAIRLGIGTDLNYWMGLTANPDGTMGRRDFRNTTIGIILQPEMVIDRLTLVGGIGIYAVHLNYGNFRQTYQRLGVRYNIYKNLSLGLNVRAINFMLAEFLEFNLGYTVKGKSLRAKR